MPALSGSDLALLRSERHRFLEYLAVMHPATVLACQLNGAPTGDPVTQITYDNVAEGAYGDVVADMTLWVGTSAGGRQKGTCRIRKAPTSSILYIAEDSAIDWENDDHLTVVNNYEYWVKYPRVIADGSVAFYKDWEVAYSDQHSAWAPVAIMGPPDCQFIDPSTGLATAKFVGEHSYAVAPGKTISSYAWTFPGGTPDTANTAGTDAAPHTVTWDTPGIYWVTLTVTDSAGKTHTGRRPVFIFERSGANAPYTRFLMTGRSGDINQHGHTASFEVHGDADQAEFPDGALVIHWTEDWYGDTQVSIGGNYKYREHLKFVGYIQRESTVKDPQTSTVTFEAATIHALMDSREGFSCWIKNKGSASNWCEATNLTADRAALSLCRYHSTLLDIADVIRTGNTLHIKSQEFEAKTSLLQQLQGLYDDLFAHVACDKQGRVYFEIDPQMKLVADRAAIPIIVDLEHGDWRERLDLPRPQENQTSFINLAGVYYPGHPSAVVPILSKAPGDAPAYTGRTTEISGLILAGQTDGNQKAGLALARDNNQFPDVTVPMAGMWDVFDIVPQEYVRLSLAAGDTKRGIVWTDQKLIPRRVELSVEQTEQGRVARTTIHVEKDSYGPAGVDGDYPDDVPDGPTNPTYPPEPTRPPGDYTGDAGPVVASHNEDGCYWSDFMGESWTARNTGLSNTAILDLIWDPWWFTAEKAGNRDPENCILWACGEGFIARSASAGVSWEDRTPTNDPPNTWGDTTAPTASTVTYKQLHGDIYHKDVFYALVEWQEPDSGNDKWRGWIVKTVDDGLTWTWYALAWVESASEKTFDFDTGQKGWLADPYYYEDADCWSIPSWYSGQLCGRNGYWDANVCVRPANNRSRWVGVKYLTQKMSFNQIKWTYRQWGGFGVGGVRLRFYTSPDGEEWTQIWTADYEETLTCPYTRTIGNSASNKYIKCVCEAHAAFGNIPYTALFKLTFVTWSTGPAQFRPLAMDVDVEDGSRIYVTTWEDGELFLCNYATSDLSLNKKKSFGEATEAEVASKTYFIVPHCPFVIGGSGFGNTVWAFGRYATGHLALSTDGGGSFVNKGSGSWDSNHRLGALGILYDGNTLLAFVNHATSPKLWQSPNQGGTWSEINSMPVNVEFEAVTRCTWSADELFIGSNAAGSQMAAWIESPWMGNWTDGTGDPPLPTASGAISSIIWVG